MEEKTLKLEAHSIQELQQIIKTFGDGVIIDVIIEEGGKEHESKYRPV